VISRRHLADYDHIRQAIFSFIKWLLAETVLIARKLVNEPMGEPADGAANKLADDSEARCIRKVITGIENEAVVKRDDATEIDSYDTYLRKLIGDLYEEEIPYYEEIKNGLDTIAGNVEELSPQERYELAVLLWRRLVDMKYSTMVSYDFLEILTDYYEQEKRNHGSKANSDSEYKYYNTFQTENKFMTYYAQLCKWVPVSGDDYHKAFAVNQLIDDIGKGRNRNDGNN
jgi:hypothetical protein